MINISPCGVQFKLSMGVLSDAVVGKLHGKWGAVALSVERTTPG